MVIRLLLLGLLLPSLSMAQDTSLRFTLPSRPYVDQNGQILQGIEGRYNRKGIDEINGGGKDYPDYKGVMIKKWYEKDHDLLLVVDGPATTLEMQGKKLTVDEAKAVKEAVFGVSDKALESGVTP